MTTERQDGAVGRVEAWLDDWPHGDVVWFANAEDIAPLTIADLRAVLAERTALAARIAKLAAERETLTELLPDTEQEDFDTHAVQRVLGAVTAVFLGLPQRPAPPLATAIEALADAANELGHRFVDRITAQAADAAPDGLSATETAAQPCEAPGVELECEEGVTGPSESQAPADCDEPDADGTCRHLTCGRCKQHTNDTHQGHYWAWCKVTKTTREFHFCCPGDCELEHDDTTEDGQHG